MYDWKKNPAILHTIIMFSPFEKLLKMGKLSKLQRKKLEQERKEKELKILLQKGKKKYKNPLRILNGLHKGYIKAYKMPSDSGYRLIGFTLNDWKNNKNFEKEQGLLYELTKTIIQKNAAQLLEDKEIGIGLVALASHSDVWIREIQDWKPDTRNPKKLFSGLVRHLIAQYPVPLFMDTAWMTQNEEQINWFIQIGQGKNIRKDTSLPISLTKKMVHYFLQAPSHYSISQALRRGQILGLGGNKKLTKGVVSTRLGERLEQDKFWRTVLHFLINYSIDDYQDVRTVVEYVQAQKFGIEREYEYEDVSIPAENPGFSMKGRVPITLLDVARKKVSLAGRALIVWKPFDIEDFTYVDKDTEVYQINQLISSEQVEKEGDTMRHCVASYIYDCVEQTSSIWSMTLKKACGKTRRVLTIEVDEEKKIVQARGKCNRKPTDKELGLLHKWAKLNELKITGDFND